MNKIINPLSYCILAILLFLILSVNFFPIAGLDKLYKYRIVLIVLYVVFGVTTFRWTQKLSLHAVSLENEKE